MASIANAWSSGTNYWTCPADVTSVTVYAWGAGGGGGGITSSQGAGGGGGGGAFASSSTVSVTPGTTYAIVVGAAGAASSTTGGTGGSTTFNSTTVVAVGGAGGAAGTGSASGAGGAGGLASASTGTNVQTGGTGGAGLSGQGGGGGGGSASPTSGGNTGGAASTGTGGTGATAVTDGAAGGSGSSSNTGTGMTAGGILGGGGGGALRKSSNGSSTSAAGGGGYAQVYEITALPYVVQAANSLSTLESIGTAFNLTSGVTSGNTVIALVSSISSGLAAGQGTISSVTLGGVTGTKLTGASTAYASGTSYDCEIWYWQNVTPGSGGYASTTTAIVANGTTGEYFQVAAIEVGNAGLISTGQAASGTGTSLSITPTGMTAGALVVAGMSAADATFASSPSVSAAPGYVDNGARGLGFAWYRATNSTGYPATWTVSTSQIYTSTALYVSPISYTGTGGLPSVASAGKSPVVGIGVYSGTGSAIASGVQPNIVVSASASPSVAAVSVGGVQPNIVVSASVAPGVAAVVAAGVQPTIAQTVTVSAGVSSVVVAGVQPSPSGSVSVAPSLASVAVQGVGATSASTQTQTVSPGVAAVSVAGVQPFSSTAVLVAPGVAAVTGSGLNLSIPLAAAPVVAVSGVQPSVTVTSLYSVSPGVAQVGVAGVGPLPVAVLPAQGSFTATALMRAESIVVGAQIGHNASGFLGLGALGWSFLGGPAGSVAVPVVSESAQLGASATLSGISSILLPCSVNFLASLTAVGLSGNGVVFPSPFVGSATLSGTSTTILPSAATGIFTGSASLSGGMVYTAFANLQTSGLLTASQPSITTSVEATLEMDAELEGFAFLTNPQNLYLTGSLTLQSQLIGEGTVVQVESKGVCTIDIRPVTVVGSDVFTRNSAAIDTALITL